MRLYSQDSRVFTRTKEILRNHSTEFADHFYQELLTTNSALATVFRNTDLSDQKEKLIGPVSNDGEEINTSSVVLLNNRLLSLSVTD